MISAITISVRNNLLSLFISPSDRRRRRPRRPRRGLDGPPATKHKKTDRTCLQRSYLKSPLGRRRTWLQAIYFWSPTRRADTQTYISYPEIPGHSETHSPLYLVVHPLNPGNASYDRVQNNFSFSEIPIWDTFYGKKTQLIVFYFACTSTGIQHTTHE